jgi:hypothetical protein
MITPFRELVAEGVGGASAATDTVKRAPPAIPQPVTVTMSDSRACCVVRIHALWGESEPSLACCRSLFLVLRVITLLDIRLSVVYLACPVSEPVVVWYKNDRASMSNVKDTDHLNLRSSQHVSFENYTTKVESGSLVNCISINSTRSQSSWNLPTLCKPSAIKSAAISQSPPLH